ncbi:MAG: PASTA domain-containing protein [Pseudomonadota bacterium]
MTVRPPVPPETLTEEFSALGPATDRLRVIGLDHAVRLQAGRTGAATRRIALARARRPEDTAVIAALETARAREIGAATAFDMAVTTAEIEPVARLPEAAIVHGLLLGDADLIAAKLTVAAIRPDGAVRRFTCADAKGYFRMDLPVEDGDEAVFLQVSDAEQAVLYRGDEAIAATPGSVTWRRITLSGERLQPCAIPPDAAAMPRLLDLPESEAMAVLARLGLALGQRLTQAAEGREGLVVSQEPAAGTPVDAATRVTLVIGVAPDGQARVEVPGVVGQPRDEAQARLQEAGLAVGRVSEQPTDRAAGTITAQVPAAGALVPTGSAVDLVVAVALPDPRVEVPDVVGLVPDIAAERLAGAGLGVGRTAFRDSDRVGLVIQQTPPAGSRAAPDSAVALIVGRRARPETVSVPPLGGRTLGAAREILGATRLVLGQVSGNPQGQIAAQEPDAGTEVPVGSAVNVTLRRRQPVDDVIVTPGGGDVVVGRPRPTPRRPVTPGPTFSTRLATRAAGDAGLEATGIGQDVLAFRLAEAGIEDGEALDRLLALDNRALAEAFGITNLARARSLRRILRQAGAAER